MKDPPSIYTQLRIGNLHLCEFNLQGCFDSAIGRYEYGGAYRGVFPVKCNHDRELITAILEAGQPYGFGLEVCSTQNADVESCAFRDSNLDLCTLIEISFEEPAVEPIP